MSQDVPNDLASAVALDAEWRLNKGHLPKEVPPEPPPPGNADNYIPLNEGHLPKEVRRQAAHAILALGFRRPEAERSREGCSAAVQRG